MARVVQGMTFSKCAVAVFVRAVFLLRLLAVLYCLRIALLVPLRVTFLLALLVSSVRLVESLSLDGANLAPKLLVVLVLRLCATVVDTCLVP